MGNLFDPPEWADQDYFTAKRIKGRAAKGEFSQAIRETDGRSGYGVIPATLIKRLLVNVQTGWGSDYVKDSVDSAGFLLTLDILLDQNPSLEEVEHFGLLCQDQLDRFVKIQIYMGRMLEYMLAYGRCRGEVGGFVVRGGRDGVRKTQLL